MNLQTDNSPGRFLVIGLGNDHRGDDGAGLEIVRRLRQMQLSGVTLREAPGDGAALLEMWQGADLVILVDAVRAELHAPGTVCRFEAHRQPLPEKFFARLSTHAFGVAEAVEMGRALGRLPPKLIVYGVAGKNFSPGANLSPEVRQGVEEVVSLVLLELE
jgi:hydrogenase maturation protease